jgi:hypothetical protein
MEQYYGRDTFSVAQELFGEDFRGLGTLYSDVDDVPHQMEFMGTAIKDTNMITNKLSGVTGLGGIVVSRSEAEHLVRSKPQVPAGYRRPWEDSDLTRSDNA